MTCRATDGCGKEYIHWEEKQTDVNLAIKIVEDCHNKRCDKVVLVSGVYFGSNSAMYFGVLVPVISV